MPQDIGIGPGTDMIYSSAVWSSATDPCSVPYLVPDRGRGARQRETSRASEPKAETGHSAYKTAVLPTTQ